MPHDFNDEFLDIALDAAMAEAGVPKPFFILSGRDLMTLPCPPRVDILGDAMLFQGAVSTLIAPPSTGKSRASIQAGVAAILGIAFGPLQGHGIRRPWLFLSGNENSRQRYRADLGGVLHHLEQGQRDTVLDLMFFHVVEEIEETMTAGTLGRITETVKAVRPGVVAVDPLGDVLAGDANADLDVRQSLRDLAHAIWHVDPKTAIWLIHHARTGRGNIAQAVGYDKGNYSKGSKAIYAACRAQINMAPGDPEDTSKVVFSCGKCNDAKPFPAFGMRLEDGIYVPDPCFDVDAWTADLEGKRAGVKVPILDLCLFLSEHPDGALQRDVAREFCVHESTAASALVRGQKGGYIRFKGQKGRSKLWVATGKHVKQNVTNADLL